MKILCAEPVKRPQAIPTHQSTERKRADLSQSVRPTASLRSWFGTYRQRYTPAFTLVELMVVIGIIALVSAIVIPASNALLKRIRVKKTLATMQVLENAIYRYAAERPLQLDNTILRHVTYSGTLIKQTYRDVFGPYPPSPTAPFRRPGDPLGVFYVSVETDPGTDVTNILTSNKFEYLLSTYLNLYSNKPCRPPKDFVSIECLLVFMRRLSPQARQIVDQLPSSAVKNIDQGPRDLMYVDLNNKFARDPADPRVDLFEVVDAWGQPLRYSVKEPVVDPNNPGDVVFPAVWELRSAGPDKFFAPPWTDEDASDDVILQSR